MLSVSGGWTRGLPRARLAGDTHNERAVRWPGVIVITAARERGLLIITCGTNTLRFVPPLVISEKEIEEGMQILEEAMNVVFKKQEPVAGTKGQEEMQDS